MNSHIIVAPMTCECEVTLSRVVPYLFPVCNSAIAHVQNSIVTICNKTIYQFTYMCLKNLPLASPLRIINFSIVHDTRLSTGSRTDKL